MAPNPYWQRNADHLQTNYQCSVILPTLKSPTRPIVETIVVLQASLKEENLGYPTKCSEEQGTNSESSRFSDVTEKGAKACQVLF